MIKKRRISRRKPRFVRKRGKITKSRNFISDTVIRYIPKSLKTPFPLRYFTRLFMNFDAIIPNGTAAEAIMPIKMNSVYLPMNGTTLGNAGTPSVAAFATIEPAGYSNFLVSAGASGTTKYPYLRWKVHGAGIRVKWYPDITDQNIQCCIVPVAGGVSAPPNMYGAMAAHPNKKMIFSSYSQNKTLHMYTKMHTVEGISKQAYADDISGQYEGGSTGGPTITNNWYVAWRLLDGSVNTPLPYWLELYYDIEFFDYMSTTPLIN